MAPSKAQTVKDYLAQLDPDRRAAVEGVRKVILANLDKSYEEGIQYGMIGYFVPHRIFPAGYHCDPRQPLPFAMLAAQKNYLSLHLMGIYLGGGDDGKAENPHARWFREEWAKTGKKLDMGKACIRFKKLDDLPLELIGKTIARIPARNYIAHYQKLLDGMGRGRKPAAAAAKAKQPAKKAKKKA